MNLYKEIKDTVYELGRWYNFPVHDWTPDSISETGIPVRKWLSTITDALPYLEFHNNVQLTRTLDLGILRGFWKHNNTCTPIEMYQFCDWLQSPESGSDRVNVQEEASILMEEAAILSTEIAYGWDFDEKLDKTKKEIRSHYEAQIRKLRQEHQQEIQELLQEKSILKKRKK